MLTPRLRLYTKNISYVRMALGLLGLAHRDAVAATERKIARYTGAKHAILTSMGRMAMYEGLRALDKKGEIILSPITVPEVISMVTLAGFTPVFCDIKPGTWNLDPDEAVKLITNQTVAVMTTHFYGNTNTTMAVRTLCATHHLLMIEDAAQALGSWSHGKHAGTTGEFGILSFSYPKNVTSFYGGCLITNNDIIAQRARAAISNYPEIKKRWLYKKVVECLIKDILTYGPFFQPIAQLIRYGYKHNIRAIIGAVTQELNPTLLREMPERYLSRLSTQQAQVIADKLPEVDEDVRHRIRCAEIYYNHLKNVSGILCPEPPGDKSHGFLYYPIQVEDKYTLQRFMIEEGCDVAIQHAQNCAELEAYEKFARDCPHARAAYQGTLMLPCYRGFPLHKAVEYAQCIQRFFKK